MFLFGVFWYGNDLFWRNLLLALMLWKIVSVPLGHPPSGAILERRGDGVCAIKHFPGITCGKIVESFPWQ
jgi:hypothetical protein